MSYPLHDTAWRCIVGARGAVRGKALYMRADTLAALLLEKGITTPGSHDALNPHLRGRTVYGVRVMIDPLMRFGEVRLK